MNTLLFDAPPARNTANREVAFDMIEQIERPSIQTVLHSSTLLNALTEEELDRLAASSRVVHVKRGEYIWLNGAQTDFFGIAGTGFVKMVKSCNDGTDLTMELMGPGQVFGLAGTVVGTGCPLSAVAVTDLWYLRVPKRLFLEIYEKSSAMKDRMVRRLTVRLHNATNMMARMSSGRVEERIAAVLFVLAESYGKRINGKLTLRVPLTRQEIGEMAGTTVESTIRVMSRWQKEGLISTDRHYVTILQDSALALVLSH